MTKSLRTCSLGGTFGVEEDGLELGEELLTIWFLAFLAGASLAICIPAGVRARRNSPFSATQLFKKRMSLIAPRGRGGRWIVVPDNHDLAVQRLLARRRKRRQRRILVLLVIATLTTGVWAFVERGIAIEINLAIDAVLVFYVSLMFEKAKRRRERGVKVRPLPARPTESTLFSPV